MPVGQYCTTFNNIFSYFVWSICAVNNNIIDAIMEYTYIYGYRKIDFLYLPHDVLCSITTNATIGSIQWFQVTIPHIRIPRQIMKDGIAKQNNVGHFGNRIIIFCNMLMDESYRPVSLLHPFLFRCSSSE